MLCAICSGVLSQELKQEDVSASLLEFGADSIFIINSFNFTIEGYTRQYALIYNGEFKKGEEIQGFSNLEKYIKDKTQLLMNERVLEKVTITYTIGDKTEDGKYPVDLQIYVKDTWNIVAIPRPKYDSNSGWDITLKARDYNFLGTMSPLRLDLGYIYDEDKKSSFKLEIDSNIPFRAFDLNWNIKSFNAFNYRPGTDQPFFYKDITGISVELPVKSTTITVGFNESFLVNEENDDIYKERYGNFQDGFYMSSNPYFKWNIPTGLEAGEWGELEYTPGLSANFNHEFPAWALDDIRKGPFLTFSHKLGFKRVDWIGNFQKGLDVSVDNSFKYDFFKSGRNKNPWNIDLKLSGTGHFIITDFFGISSRLMYRQWAYYDYGYDKAGDVLRGIPDKDIYADYMISLNLDFPVRVLRFLPSVWLDKPKLRIFNLDLHLSPVIDTMIYHDPVNNTEFSLKNTLVAGGMEIIVFPEFFRSLYLRISFGWNLSDFSKWRGSELFEFFLGTDFHY
jgi:hypothetical protein